VLLVHEWVLGTFVAAIVILAIDALFAV